MQHKQWGEFKKSGGKPKYNKNSGKSVHHMDHTHSDEDHDLCLWSLYQKEVNSVNEPLVAITIEHSLIQIRVDPRSSVNLVDEKLFLRLKQFGIDTE